MNATSSDLKAYQLSFAYSWPTMVTDSPQNTRCRKKSSSSSFQLESDQYMVLVFII